MNTSQLSAYNSRRILPSPAIIDSYNAIIGATQYELDELDARIATLHRYRAGSYHHYTTADKRQLKLYYAQEYNWYSDALLEDNTKRQELVEKIMNNQWYLDCILGKIDLNDDTPYDCDTDYHTDTDHHYIDANTV